MAILLSQADGSDQHYDTYEEFEQAFVLLKRLNGEKVPQDLLDEVKAKYGEKEDAEELDETSKDRAPVSDEVEIPENVPKFEIGDKVIVVDNTSSGHVDGTIGEIIGVECEESENRWTYEVRPISNYIFEHSLRHRESDLEILETSDDEFEIGDKVRVVSANDGTVKPYHFHAVGRVGKVVSMQRFGRIEVDVDGENQYLLPHHYEKIEPFGRDADGVYLLEGDYVTGTIDNDYEVTNYHSICEVKSNSAVKVIQSNDDLGRQCEGVTFGDVDLGKFIKLSDNLGEAKAKFDELNGEEVVEEDSPTKFRTGDIVKVTKSFKDIHGDMAASGSVCVYEEWGESLIFVGSVILGDNHDKLQLVCRKEDRKDVI